MNRVPRLSLDLLRAFRAAAAHASFTRAAQELSVTQSAISHAVRTLEEQLGRPLFHRVNRALRLTHAGETLYRATDDALHLVDSAAARIAGAGDALGVTTTVALASLWLVPRLPQFTRTHPAIDVRIVATNDRIDLAREHLDLALHFVPSWETPPDAERLVDYLQFPVCAPALARRRGKPLAQLPDLAHHVRLDFETVVYGRAWYDWEHWSNAIGAGPLKPAGTMRFSHYDQVINAVEGGGVAIGKWPHLARHLREGLLCIPLGASSVARLGAFHLVLPRAPQAGEPLAQFVAWLQRETRADDAQAPPLLGRTPQRKPRRRAAQS